MDKVLMITSFLPYLMDPKTGEDLELKSEYLVSKSNKYPIIRGVPRFSGYQSKTNYAQSFGFEWNKWSRIQFESENIGKPMAGHTSKMWESIVGGGTKHIKGKLIIDYGCGPGRFIEIARKKGAKVIGIDLSDAVEAARNNFKDDPNVLIVQGDILHPPFKKQIADGAFSIGVLMCTENPSLGFNQIVKCVKPSGWVAVSLYGEIGLYTDPIISLYRKISKTLWPYFGPFPALIYSYGTVNVLQTLSKVSLIKYPAYILKMIFPYIDLPDKNWSVLDTFDMVTPVYQTGHSVYEVFDWFKRTKKFKLIEPSNWGGATLWGIKK